MKARAIRAWQDSALRHIKAIAGIVSFIAVCIGLLVLAKGEAWRETNIGLCILHGVYLALIFYLIWVIIMRRPPEFLGTPKVIRIMRPEGLLIVEEAPWISLGVMTAIYIMEDDVERLVCVGEIANVQFNGLVQVSLRSDERGYADDEEIWKVLDRTDKRDILVKPRLYPGGP